MRRGMKVLATAALSLGVLAGDGERAGARPPLPLPAPKVTPIQVTGPPAQRLNLIILGDGYQWDQQSIFYADVDRNLSVMWATEPFRTLPQLHQRLRGRDRVDRLRRPLRPGRPRAARRRHDPRHRRARGADRRQEHRAADDLPERLHRPALPRHGLRRRAGQLRNAAALAKYYPAGRDHACETGNQAHNRILDTYVAPVLGIPRTSQNLQTLAIFNTFTYGGIGGSQATTSGGSPQGPLISLHEIGHSLGTLADEYPYSSRDVVRPCYTGGEPGSFHHTIIPSAAQMLAAQTSGGAGSARRASPAARSACTRAAARSRAASAGRASTR